MEEKNLRDELERKVLNLLEKTESMEPGTEKHSKAIDDICRLCRAYEDDYKTEVEAYTQNLKAENDIKRNEEEIHVKKLQLDLEEKKHNKVKADNIFMMAGFGFLTIGACVYEVTGGHIIPGKVLQFANYIPKAMKL